MKPAVHVRRTQRMHPAPNSLKPAPTPPIVTPMRRPASTIIDCPAVKEALQMAATRQGASRTPSPIGASTPSRKPFLRIAAGAFLAMLAILGASRLMRSKPQALKAADGQVQQISEALAKDAYPEAFQLVSVLEGSLRNSDGEWVSEEASQTVTAQYQKLDQWLGARYGKMSNVEHDIVHALLVYYSAESNRAIHVKSVQVNEGHLTLTAERDECNDIAVAEPQSLPALPSMPPPPPDSPLATGCCLPQAIQKQRPTDADGHAIGQFVIHRFSAIDSIEIKWLGNDGAQHSTFSVKREDVLR